jgi:hypothetical protein
VIDCEYQPSTSCSSLSQRAISVWVRLAASQASSSSNHACQPRPVASRTRSSATGGSNFGVSGRSPRAISILRAAV